MSGTIKPQKEETGVGNFHALSSFLGVKGGVSKCTIGITYLVLALLLFTLIHFAYAQIRSAIGTRPRNELALSKWASLFQEHAYISAFVPCHYRCAMIHCQQLVFHLLVMALNVYVLVHVMDIHSQSPMSIAVAIFISALFPNVWRPLLHFVFHHVEPVAFHEDIDISHFNRLPTTTAVDDHAPSSQAKVETVPEVIQYFDDIHVEELNLPQEQVVAIVEQVAEVASVINSDIDEDFAMVGLYRPQGESYSQRGLIGGTRRRHSQIDTLDDEDFEPGSDWTSNSEDSDEINAAIETLQEVIQNYPAAPPPPMAALPPGDFDNVVPFRAAEAEEHIPAFEPFHAQTSRPASGSAPVRAQAAEAHPSA
ncbi:MAG: hypothetical protein FJ267_16970, partial [Planctomycetes bacterium]|nr:hypothetical protein [Planctomycetota bacterium]